MMKISGLGKSKINVAGKWRKQSQDYSGMPAGGPPGGYEEQCSSCGKTDKVPNMTGYEQAPGESVRIYCSDCVNAGKVKKCTSCLSFNTQISYSTEDGTPKCFNCSQTRNIEVNPPFGHVDGQGIAGMRQ